MDIVPDAVTRARSAGADAAEAFGMVFTTRSVYVEDDVPKVGEDRREAGLGIRVAKGKRVAFASTTLAGPSDAASVARAATATVRRVPEDPDFTGFPTEAATGEVHGTWDSATASAGVEVLAEAAQTFTSAARRRKGTTIPKAIFRVQDYSTRVANSNRIAADHRGTLVFCYLTATAGSPGKRGEGIVKALSPSLTSIDFAALGETTARRAAENRTARALRETRTGTTIIDPLDLGEIFLATVGSAVNGQNVHKKRSAWIGKVGQTVGSLGLTIRDRPRMPGGLASCVADDEGNATRDRTLVLAGALQGYVADKYHSGLIDTPAGNGFRRSVATVEGAYSRPAETHLSNLVVEPGTKDVEALIAEVDRGVYVEKFAAPEVNEFSGSFAMEVRNATMIEKGELTDHVKFALLTGNFYEGLKRVVAIGRDVAPSHGSLLTPGCAYVPPMAFDGFELVGQT